MADTMAPRLTLSHSHLAQQRAIAQLRDSLIDLDIVVDDARQELMAAIERTGNAVRERDAVALQLLAAIDAAEAA